MSGGWEDVTTASSNTGWEDVSAPKEKPKQGYSIKDMFGLQDASAAMSSGMVAGPVAGYAGILGSILPGPAGQGAKWTQNVGEALTYKPRTKSGQQITDLMSVPGRVVSATGNLVGDKIADTEIPGSAFMGAWMNGLTNALPLALGLRGSKPTGALAEAQSRNALRDSTLKNAQDKGFVVPPSAVNPTFIGNRLESISGKAAIGQDAALKNQIVANRLAAEQAGLPPSAPISVSALEQRRNALAQPYRDARGIDPAVAQMVDDLANARLDAKDYWKAYRGPSGRPDDRIAATNASARVANIEAQIEAAAQNSGIPGLVDRLKDARKNIAQVHDVERSLNVATGDVSAPTLGAMLDKGAPLTGNLKAIAEFQQAFPAYAREGAKVPTPGVSKSEALTSVLLGVGGGGAFGVPGALLAALPLVSPAVRAGLLSKYGQQMLAKPNYSSMVSDPYLQGILASSSANPERYAKQQ